MSYSLAFVESALKDWRKLAPAIAEQFKKKKSERLAEPRVLSARLHQMPDCYKIKLRTIGYRSVYQVDDTAVTVSVVAVGKREKSEVYRAAGEPEREWLAGGKDEAAAGRCVETAGLLKWE